MTYSLWKVLLVFFLPFASMATSKTVTTSKNLRPEPQEPMFAGSWKLTSVFDDEMAPIIVPEGDFRLTLEPSKDFWRSGNYDMGLKIGNRLGGRMTALVRKETDGLGGEKRNIRIGPVRSTMMMPEASVFRLEVALTDILPAAATAELVIQEAEGTTLLVLEGPKGKLICEKLE
jgi:hypothetical protein